MKTAHSTTTLAITYVRILALLILSVFFVNLVPYPGQALDTFISTHATNIGILYAIIIGFMLSITLHRKQALDEYISLELNKIRRIYHLGKHIRATEPQLDKWFTELKDGLTVYLGFFREVSFRSYERGNPLFRNVTYTIYRLPQLGIPYNTDLYKALLDAAASATEAREYIRAKKDNFIGNFQWAIIILVTVTFSIILAATAPQEFVARTISAVVILNLMLVLHLLYEYDRSNEKRDRHIADQYSQNLTDALEQEENKGKKKKS